MKTRRCIASTSKPAKISPPHAGTGRAGAYLQQLSIPLPRRTARRATINATSATSTSSASTRSTGESTQIEANDRFTGLFTDPEFKVRSGARVDRRWRPATICSATRPANGSMLVARRAPRTRCRTRPIEFSDDGKELYRLDSRGRDKAAVVVQDMAKRRHARARRRCAGRFLRSDPDAGQLACRWRRCSTTQRQNWQRAGSRAFADDFAAIAQLGRRRCAGWCSRPTTCAIGSSISSAMQLRGSISTTTELEQQGRTLFVNRPALQEAPLVQMQPVVVKGARRTRACLLSVASARCAWPYPPTPMVLLVHGGPGRATSWALYSAHQWLANRGYAVLSVNFRGSTGFGKAFVNAANLEWGGKMHDDLIDAVDWAIAQKIADPDKVAIYGASYGGYAALVGVTFTPEISPARSTCSASPT